LFGIMHSALPARPQPMVRSLGHISKKERNVTSTNNHPPVSFEFCMDSM